MKPYRKDVRMARIFIGAVLICLARTACADADEKDSVPSVHAGFLYPNGVDVAGYTVERKPEAGGKLYRFYTFGFPSLAAAGVSYYDNFDGSGLVATAGVGIGFVLYSSVAYQWRLDGKQYIKLGVGYATGIAYSGAFPALSYEHRLD